MKLWKRMVALVLCMVLASGFYACKEDTPQAEQPQDDAEQAVQTQEAPGEEQTPTQPPQEQPPESNIGKYNYLEKSLLIQAEEQDLSQLTENKTKLTIRIPEDWQPENLEVYCNNEPTSVVISPDALTPLEETVVITGNRYSQYEYTLDTEAFTENSNYVFLRMGEKRSNSVDFFRPLELSEADVETIYNTLAGLSEAASAVYTNQELSADVFLNVAMQYLQSSENVASIEQKGNTIFFTMHNGMTSFFTAEEVTEELSASLGNTDTADTPATTPEAEQEESNSYTETPIVVTGECNPNTYFEKNQNSKEYLSTINPNILVMAPVRSTQRDIDILHGGADGEAEKEYGRELQEALLYGDLTVVVDEECSCNTIRDWDKYGTVMLNTHGPEDNGLVKNTGRDNLSTFFLMAQTRGMEIFAKNSLSKFNEMLKRWSFGGGLSGRSTIKWYLNNSVLGVTAKFANATEQFENPNLLEIMQNSGYVMGTLFFTADYLEYLLADAEFDNTVFILDVCNGLSDPKFNDFLLSRGAACVWGYKSTVSAQKSKSLIKNLGDTQLAVQEETEHSLRWALHDQAIINGKTKLECERLEGNGAFTYYGHTMLHGVVNDRLVGTPVKDVSVNLYRYYDGNLQIFKDTKTNEQGLYEFEEVPFGLYMIAAKFRDETVIINFSVGSMEKKELNIKISEYIPIYTVEDMPLEESYCRNKYLLMNDLVLPDDYQSRKWGENLFDGGGHTISNIQFPVFEMIHSSQIMNLNLIAAENLDLLPCLEKRRDYGLLASEGYGLTISNCHASGEVFVEAPADMNGSLAGLIGTLEDSILEHCTNRVNITFNNVKATSFVGGLAAYAFKCNYLDCHNYGDLYLSTEHSERYISTGFFLRIGGLAGNGSGTMQYCSNTGSVSSVGGHFVGTRAGGLIGEGDVTLQNCWNSGKIYAYMPTHSSLGQVDSLMQGTSSIGGQGEADNLRNGVNNTNFMFWYDPAAGGHAGGLVGFSGAVKAHNCYNSGEVNSTYFTAGLVGRTAFLELCNTVNLGEVKSNFCAAGMVGFWYNSSSECLMQSSYMLGAVSGEYITGSFYGFTVNEKARVDNSGVCAMEDNAIGCRKAPVFGTAEGIQNILNDPNYDFEDVWNYSEQGGLTLRPYPGDNAN